MRNVLKWMAICTGVALVIGGGIIVLVGPKVLHEQDKFKMKVQSSEAKIFLTSLYTAEMSFQIEHEFFTTDLETAGLAYDADSAPRLYEIGFVKPSQDPALANGDRVKTDPKRMLLTKTGLQSVTAQRLPAQAIERCSDCTADKEHFKAFAVGHIGSAGALDVWTVDEKHRLVHVVDGTAE